jgi:NTP pyrophosphatase (non-canonical NTP hydrolase)
VANIAPRFLLLYKDLGQWYYLLMQFNEYQNNAIKTAKYPKEYKIVYPALGLADETGETIGKIKKWLRGDDGVGKMTKERREALKFELGDVLWYLSILARDLGYDFDEIAKANIEKLSSRNKRGVIKGSGDYR